MSSSSPSSALGTGGETPTINLHLSSLQSSSSPSQKIQNPFPPLIQTPSGLAILELQGTFNTTEDNPEEPLSPLQGTTGEGGGLKGGTELGTITFPDYRPDDVTGSTSWMKKVYLFVGQHQRLVGEVKKLPKPLGVVRRRQQGTKQQPGDAGIGEDGEQGDGGDGVLEIVEVIKYKIVFSQRPEPVTETGGSGGDDGGVGGAPS